MQMNAKINKVTSEIMHVVHPMFAKKTPKFEMSGLSVFVRVKHWDFHWLVP